MSYECDNDSHDIGCQCPGRAPDFTDLLKRDLIAYCEGRGLSTADANKRGLELLEFVQREASKFT